MAPGISKSGDAKKSRSKRDDSNAGESKRYGRGPVPGAAALAAVVRKVAGPHLRRQGFFESGIVTDWPAIVGEFLAERCAPDKLAWPRGRASGATLGLRVEGAFAPELQHLAPQLIERINGHFGFAAVAQLKYVHAPPRTSDPARKALRELGAEEQAALSAGLAKVESGGIRAALEALGRAVLAASGTGASGSGTGSATGAKTGSQKGPDSTGTKSR